MKILSNKYFIYGNLFLLLLAIPVTLFFIKKQQEVRSKAAASSKLYFNPASPNTSTQCPSFTMDVMIDPGSNIASIVNFYITYDPTKLDITGIKEGAAFPVVIRPASITSGAANMSVSVGTDVTKAVQTITKVATITFTPKAAGPAQVQFDAQKSQVFSLSTSDQPTENVLLISSLTPSNVNIGTEACPTGGLTPTVSVTPTGPTTTPHPSVTLSPTSSPSPTLGAANLPPVCTEFSVSPSASGSAPFSVLFTAKGNDPDGLVAKTTFNFGDGQTQDVVDGMNLKNVTAQTNHTYQNAGTFGAIATFTDNASAISQSCSQTITVSGASGSATTTPAPTVAGTTGTTSGKLTATPTTGSLAPTIAPTGSISKTLGIIGAVILTIMGGFLLLAL